LPETAVWTLHLKAILNQFSVVSGRFEQETENRRELSEPHPCTPWRRVCIYLIEGASVASWKGRIDCLPAEPAEESEKLAKKVAELFIEVLAAAGVERIYGVAGDSLNGITDSVRVRKEMQWVGVRHEETAAFAAGAETALTGKLAVCAGSCGPGNLHLIMASIGGK
jgi:hypothetical protein